MLSKVCSSGVYCFHILFLNFVKLISRVTSTFKGRYQHFESFPFKSIICRACKETESTGATEIKYTMEKVQWGSFSVFTPCLSFSYFLSVAFRFTDNYPEISVFIPIKKKNGNRKFFTQWWLTEHQIDNFSRITPRTTLVNFVKTDWFQRFMGNWL